jgi:hypothetical protein
MPIEVIPSGSTAVVTEKHSHHPDNWDLSTEMQRDLNHVRTQAEKEFIEISNQAERNQAADVVRDALSQSKVQGSELNTQKGLDQGFKETMLRADGHSEKSQKQIGDAATATVVGFKDAQALAYQVQGQALLEAAKNASAASVQATSNFNLASVQATTFAYEAQLQAQTIAAAAAAKAAECCCELKEKIGADGQKTRDLINSITEQNLRDRAQRSESALAAYFAAKVAPTSPVVG